MSIDAVSSPWMQAIRPMAPPLASSGALPETAALRAFVNDLTPVSTPGSAALQEDPGLMALMRDWVLQAITTPSPLLSDTSWLQPNRFGVPFGDGLGLESLATAYDYDNFAGENSTTPSYLLNDGMPVTAMQLDMLV